MDGYGIARKVVVGLAVLVALFPPMNVASFSSLETRISPRFVFAPPVELAIPSSGIAPLPTPTTINVVALVLLLAALAFVYAELLVSEKKRQPRAA